MFLSSLDDLIERHADPRVKDYFLATSIWKPISIISLYLLFVNKIGPWYMRNRKPYDVKKWIILFDITQILINFYITVEAGKVLYGMKGSFHCLEVDTSDSPTARNILFLANAYHMVKISDIVDTVFFILKASYRQASYLHVYHHSAMILFSWIGLKFVPGGHSVYIGITNSFVHIIMYSYYLLSTINVEYKTNLTMKKFVTHVQLTQFIFLFSMYASSLLSSCNYPKLFSILCVVQALYFIYLFGQFYYNTYIVDKTDARTNELYFGNSVWKPLGIIALYILVVKKIGPWYMKNRQPYDVRKFIIAFDIFQIIANLYLTYMMVTNYFTSDSWICCDVDYSDRQIGRTQLYLVYYYHLLKITDVVDTMFFILKKNDRQISHLHVYHHSLMIIFSWMGLKYVAGGQTLIVGITNTFVHGVMYSYYLLTAINEKYRRNVAIKKFVTQIQIGQFVLMLTLGVFYMWQPCKFPRPLMAFGMIQTSYLLYLFSRFYYREYIVKPKKG